MPAINRNVHLEQVMRSALALMLLAVPAIGPASAQDAAKPLGAEDLVAILDPKSGPALQADQIAAILLPAETARSSGPRAPGEWGSGALPDVHVRFEPGSAELAPSAEAQLKELAAALNGDLLKDFRFEIRGYTDAAGDEAANQRLSKGRADAVARQLADHGVAGERVRTVGLGERELARPDQPGSAMNRRVEVRTLAGD